VPLLVVPVAVEEAGLVTIAEWDELVRSGAVWFEVDGHPLADRLAAAGIEIRNGPIPDADDDGVAVVLDPRSGDLVRLAKAGATVTSGPASAPDALTAAHGAYLARRGSASLGNLGLVMARLRSSDGCPWDQEQTHGSLRTHLLEEAYEVLEAIDAGDLTAELEEELGDLLLQVVFHAQLAADDDRFDLAGVADSIVAKLIHRHPHVFADRSVANADEVVRNWEAIKKDEKKREGPFDGIPAGLPALLAAFKVQKRATALGFQPDAQAARSGLDDALGADPPDIGAALFWLVALARSTGVDPEGSLREETASFKLRHGSA
jgi:XTP/dITP diphosphohydrolase